MMVVIHKTANAARKYFPIVLMTLLALVLGAAALAARAQMSQEATFGLLDKVSIFSITMLALIATLIAISAAANRLKLARAHTRA